MTEKQTAERRAYIMAWRAANPDKVRAQAKAYREANPMRVRGKQYEWRVANSERAKITQANWRAANGDRVAVWPSSEPVAKSVKYSAWRAQNIDRLRAAKTFYRAANRDKGNMQKAVRRARKQSATPPWLTKEDHNEILKFYTEAKRLNHHVDHVVPLRGKNVSGLHVPWNLQVLPPTENLKKANRLI